MVIRRSLMPKQIFYDPRRKRWTYVRLLLDVLGIAITGLILFFVISAFRPEDLNPLLMPQPPAGLGVGPISSQYQLFQIVPTLAYQLTEKISIGVSPISLLPR